MTLEALITKQRVIVALPIFLAFAAWNTGNELAYFLSALAAAVAVFAHGVPLLQLKNVTVARFVPDSGQEMKPLRWTLTVSNSSWWPRFMLEVVDRAPESIAHRFEPRFQLPFLRPRASRVIEEEVTLPRRGLYRFGPLAIESAFPVGILERRSTLQSAIAETVIYPELFEVGTLVLPPTRANAWAASSSSAGVGGDTDFWGVREYRHGDSRHRVHWAASARHGVLLVKEFERPAPTRRLVIALDQNRSFEAGSGRESAFEYQVRIAASIAKYCVQRGWQVGLVGLGSKEVVVDPGSGTSCLARLMRTLACVECDGVRPYNAGLQRARALSGPAGVLLTFSSAPGNQSASTELDACVSVFLERESFVKPADNTSAPHAPVVSRASVQYYVRRGQPLASIFRR
jgi:uncharacterized protein (DUF58 family)